MEGGVWRDGGGWDDGAGSEGYTLGKAWGRRTRAGKLIPPPPADHSIFQPKWRPSSHLLGHESAPATAVLGNLAKNSTTNFSACVKLYVQNDFAHALKLTVFDIEYFARSPKTSVYNKA